MLFSFAGGHVEVDENLNSNSIASSVACDAEPISCEENGLMRGNCVHV